MTKLKTRLRRFLACDRGAVTLDWVALSAGAVVLGIMTVYAIFSGNPGSVNALVDNLTTEMGVMAENLVGVASPPPPPLR